MKCHGGRPCYLRRARKKRRLRGYRAAKGLRQRARVPTSEVTVLVRSIHAQDRALTAVGKAWDENPPDRRPANFSRPLRLLGRYDHKLFAPERAGGEPPLWGSANGLNGYLVVLSAMLLCHCESLFHAFCAVTMLNRNVPFG